MSQSSDIKMVPIEEEMKRSYLDYAMSVIVSRALPDVRDGLKPVHRRILHAMKEAGNEYNRPYRKSARVVGDVMGKYHPHGNMPIYDAMVRLTQNFSLRLPLIDGQGNFGSIDGDSPAAERYTEARLSRAAHDLLEDIDKQTVDFQPNYDETTEEPKVLPARFPNLLVNGANGIAVGMATNIPTHNLGEVIEACCTLIDNPDADLMEIMKILPAPDFPTGGIILGRHGLLEAYRTGRGSITIRSVTHIEPLKGDREAIVITEIPYQVNKARMVEKIADLVKAKIVEGISELRDESDREGIRVVIELKRDAVSDVVLNQLYRYSPLQTSFSFNMLALTQGRPEQLSLIQILKAFLQFREEVILRRTRYELRKARDKAHTLAGFALALANIDEVIALIRGAKDRAQAREELLSKSWKSNEIASLLTIIDSDQPAQESYYLSETQANAILDLRLHRLTGLERDKIQADLEEGAAYIQDRLDILRSRDRVLSILKNELIEIKERFPSPRRTQIEEGDSTVDMEDLIQKEDMVVTVSIEGYIKRVPLSTYRAQKRGGRGRSGMTTRDEDAVGNIFVANTHDRILFFSTLGRVYQMKVYKLPLASPQAKGRALINLLPLASGETISTILVFPHTKEVEYYLMFATSLGNVRRNKIEDFDYIPSNGKRAMKLDEGESLVGVVLCEEQDDILLSTQRGICNRFNVDNIRVFSGRDSNGVRGIRLQEKDHVISMAVLKEGAITLEEREAYLKKASKMRQTDSNKVEENEKSEVGEGDNVEVESNTPEQEGFILDSERFDELALKEQFILTITENGYGKRSSAYEYRKTQRGSQGFTNIITNERNGGVAASFPVCEHDEIMLVTDQGRLIRCPVGDIRITGRRALGVIIFRVDAGEHVVAVSRIEREEGEEAIVEEEEGPVEV